MRRLLRGAAALAGALAQPCYSINTDCYDIIGPQRGVYMDLTPVNAFYLREHLQ